MGLRTYLWSSSSGAPPQKKSFQIIAQLFLSSENETEYVITFEDNGIGIKPEYMGKIFEPFFTTKECSNDENGGGEGLGLYIIWNIVRMFDGNIKVDKKYQNGARFIINILKKERYKHE